jgi:hypothetical protein
VIIDGATHGAAYRTRPEAYREALLGFLAELMGPPPLKGQ